MKEEEETMKMSRLNISEGGGNNGSEAGVVGRDGGDHVYISDQSFKGILAELKITAFEMWREIVMYLWFNWTAIGGFG